ncbi:YoaK family protein [Paeniclostridium sordellii]|uniref:YoaK family protein n=1 Tax=Paraclostridium sordellii TaxID=1505 RepID=UPI0005E6ED21|nr:YoaK family protein [Paeniclostridium sordellii]MCQ4696780.1 YoaK family protein [Paeniclostridium sordellii]MDU6248800.1 YoaK family protein [Paeniclostridium sordellii]CEQ20325.1 Predicted membrane protein [[Clostridium] sordellii] [Paeniclostridium sordellii]
MKNNNQIKHKVPPWEKPIFVMIITIVGGYMNGYTYITRHNILANMHTANMSKLGINIALGQWQNALSYFIPIVACILGAAFSELVKALLIIHKFKGDWRKIALILESISLFFIGLIPTSCPDIIVTNLVSFFMGYQLCLFRECLGIGFNTTICTGNIRNVGQLLYNALDEKSKNSIRKLIIFTCLTFSFALGAIPGTLISIAISTKAVWVCSFILLSQAVWINIYEHNVV